MTCPRCQGTMFRTLFYDAHSSPSYIHANQCANCSHVDWGQDHKPVQICVVRERIRTKTRHYVPTAVLQDDKVQ